MTTTIYDVEAKLVCSDSRWSTFIAQEDGSTSILYIDNTNFDKVANIETAVLLLAGDAELIAQWKRWWHEDAQNKVPHPELNLGPDRNIVLTIISKPTNQILFDAGPKLTYYCYDEERNLAVFAGSGSKFAADHWGPVRCAIRSVEEAAENDPCTGGNVKFVEFDSNINNLSEPCYDKDEILKNIMDKGMIMEINTLQNGQNKIAIPLADHPNKDMIKNMVATGQVHAGAPTGNSTPYEWTSERKDKLQQAIDTVFNF